MMSNVLTQKQKYWTRLLLGIIGLSIIYHIGIEITEPIIFIGSIIAMILWVVKYGLLAKIT